MEPVLLVCGGCGVRIRTRRPENARTSDCPRCGSPLASAVDLALGIELTQDDLKLASPTAPARRLTTAALAILVTVGSLATLAVREASPGSEPPASPTRGLSSTVLPVVRNVAHSVESPATANSNVQTDISEIDEIPKLSDPPGPPSRDLAILDLNRRDPVLPPPAREVGPRTGSLDRSPPLPPQPDGSLESTPTPLGRSTELQRLVVRDTRGRSIVAREFGILRKRLAAILPDGQIGWPEGLVPTQEPFVPLTMDQMKRELLEDPEFTTFQIHQTAHYLIMYQCGEPFARASGELLEKLHDGLTSTLKKNGLPIVPMEFPLVAVIFATEDDFRANRPVAPDVQAYYEPLSNRIFFYEKSRRDQDSPEVSALRKPQTVAHEGTHQILNNVGIQPRLSDWPIWLVEGLAEYCSSPQIHQKGGRMGRDRPAQPDPPGHNPRPRRPNAKPVPWRPSRGRLPQGSRDAARRVPRDPNPEGPDSDRLRTILGPHSLPGRPAARRLRRLHQANEPAPAG